MSQLPQHFLMQRLIIICNLFVEHRLGISNCNLCKSFVFVYTLINLSGYFFVLRTQLNLTHLRTQRNVPLSHQPKLSAIYNLVNQQLTKQSMNHKRMSENYNGQARANFRTFGDNFTSPNMNVFNPNRK